MQNSSVLQVLVLLGISVIALTLLARRIGVAPPIVLLVGGVPLAFVPWLADVRLPPQIVLLIFLPVLLNWETLNTSLREIRANLRVVMLNSILLVLVTAAAVAVVAHHLGLSWPVAWVLGAVLAPTDATAVAAVARRMPRRQVTILRAESLINDGTALVLFAIAVQVASGESHFGWPQAIGAFVLSYLGGAAAGLVVAWLTTRTRMVMRDPLLENTVNVLAPFTAFLLAEQIHASGVLAVVVSGLALSQINPRIVPARTRVPARAFLQLTAFMLNGTLFVLIGLQLRDAVQDLVSYSLADAAGQALLISAVVIGTRLLWSYTTPYLIRAIDRRPQQRLRRIGARNRLPVAWAGFRGGVSLAAALAVPAATTGRDLIIIVTFGVILVTMVVQGLTLPAVLRWSRLVGDGSEQEEQRLALHTMTEAAMAALPAEAARLGVSDDVVERMHSELEERLAELDAAQAPAPDAAAAQEPGTRSPRKEYKLLHLALLATKRAALVRLRDDRLIDDIVLRRLQARLDAEELRHSALETESD